MNEPQTTDESGPDERVEKILGEWRSAREEGVAAAPEAVIRQHPDLADALRNAFQVMDALDDLLLRSPPSERPVPCRIGPYEVQRELGRGGMGTVYLAKSAGNGESATRTVALKVVHPFLMERPDFRQRFLREAELGRRIVHENVVRTLGVDTDETNGETLLYLVMEFVKGRTLRELLGDLGIVPEALVREIALQAAVGLNAIHAAGIFHRDLKPENILITDDERLRIMDLGVARLFEDSAPLTRDGQFAGSLVYASPEQFGRGAVGPATDLYALGVLLYELATGDNPFRHDEPASVMRSHLDFRPPPASEGPGGVSVFFAELLATLLSKRPEDRFPSAAALERALREEEDSEWWRSRAEAPTGAAIPRVPVRRETRLQGRASELDLLRSAWSEACDGEGSTVLVEGEAGIGKSRLIGEFLESIDAGQAHVLYGSHAPSGGRGGWTDAVQARFGTADLKDRLGRFIEETPSLVPAFAAHVEGRSAPEGAAFLSTPALHTVCCHLMRGLARDRPLIFIVEDLHFAEIESLQILLSMARATAGHRVLLVLTTRPGLPEAEIASLALLPEFRKLPLGRLSAREVVLLLKDAFRSLALAEKLGGTIALKSDGIPLFVFEMIRGLRDGQFITELPDGTYVESREIRRIEVPSAIVDLIEVRLGSLSDGDRNLLDVAAVMGYEFEADLVARALETSRIRVLQRLAAVERQYGVIRAVGRRYRFDHHQFQEVVYEGLADSLKEEYHTILARSFEARLAERGPGAGGPEAARFLASHHLRGATPEAALPHLLPTIDHLAETYRNSEALELMDRALRIEGLLDDRHRLQIQLKNGSCCDVLGRRQDQGVAIDEAVRLADRLGEFQGKAHLRLGTYHQSLGQWDEAQAEYRRARELDEESGDGSVSLGALANLATIDHILGKGKDAESKLQEALAFARSTGNREVEGKILGNLGASYSDTGQCDKGIRCMERSLEILREAGNRAAVATQHGLLGRALAAAGRVDEACLQVDRRLTMAREIGDRWNEASAAAQLGKMNIDRGRFEEAREWHRLATALHAEIENPMGALHCRLGQSLALIELGLLREAVSLAERVVEESEAVRVPGLRILALGNLGRVAMLLGDHARARRCIEEARELAGDSVDMQAALRLLLAELREMEGDEKHAVALCEEPGPSVDTLTRQGALLARCGEASLARAALVESLLMAQETEWHGPLACAGTWLAVLDDEPGRAAAVYREHSSSLGCVLRLQLTSLLWRATGDSAFLAESHRLLSHLLENAPPEFRGRMLEGVPACREVASAWERDQDSQA